MDAWGKNLNADKITMLSDGNCEFTESMGLIMDGSGFGLGRFHRDMLLSSKTER